MMQKKRGLGRGLSELLGDVSQPVQEKPKDSQSLPIEFLQRGKFQPRKDMDPEKLKELSDSIAAQGIIQPIIVRKLDGEKYEIIAGERRWRAAQLAELQDVPVLVKDLDDRSVMAIALIENIQREDLNALEEAEALHRLQDEFELTHQQIATAVGKSRTTITNLLRLLELAGEVKGMLGKGLLEMGHARALLGLDEAKQIEIANKAVKQGLTVRAVEKLVREQHEDKPVAVKKIDPDTLRLQRDLSERTGAKVEINHQSSGKGKLIFSYTSLEELEGIIKKIN
ncbi:ParB/RepB/Spo0J family partition protein [Methylomonas methanica]|jgi:ParB family chromosome partitioning protein|uniref:Probable chromosome-partitioning protein ParB n=1 Tax=Methylomonas methanica TaxID=421 RepID=A0A177LWG1_METMH|nr:ParB/RepB/Spo0J family partition protein [Methylomonas methanica]OAH97836.1 chromosome partitioning protein ParB [Methylomonas methanica]OAI10895.1 chromosome partitioning protein ParB [Methylomonas methanica]